MSNEEQSKTDDGQSRLTGGLGDWLPIDTAPKNGTVVILFFPRHGVLFGKWHQPGNKSVPGFWTGSGHNYRDPTHWIPLPKGPNE